MAEKLSLEKTWELCLEMWKWISEVYEEGNNVNTLKEEWLDNNGFEEKIRDDCFFCDYNGQNNGNSCSQCPGKLVDEKFSCQTHEYDFYYKPVEFYNKLLELNKIRKGNTMKEMTVAEISEALGEEIKVVKEKPKPEWKFGDTAKNAYDTFNHFRVLLYDSDGVLRWFYKADTSLIDVVDGYKERAEINSYVKTGNIFETTPLVS